MKNIFWLPLIASLLMAACTDKELDDNIIPRDGEEVNFSVSVNDNKSRTLYGDEAEDGKSVVVNWVKGDKVLVYGTTCSNPSAEYKVGDAADGKNYAGELVKTGAAGIQWGTKTMSDFYSVYPSNSKITPNTTDADGNVTSVKVTTEIRKHQNVTFKKNTNGVWVGQHFSDDSDNPTMTDAVMYAVEKGVTAGKTVNLGYKPFTTVLRFNFAGYQAEGEMGGDINSKIYVNKITINSPFAISGKFSMTVGYDEDNNDSFAVVDEENLKVTEDNSQIVIYPDYLPLANAEQLQFDVFAIPQDYVLTNDNYFVVTIETNSGQFIYHMKPTVVDGKKNKMLAGAMHKVNIPMKKISKPFEIPVSEWMKYVPRNVYLSELSMPGAWYCLDKSYQGDAVSLQELYNAGVRAFNIDCRVTRSKFDEITSGDPWNDSRYTNGEYHFACSGTEQPGTYSILGWGYCNMREGTYVKEAVKQLVALANANPHEFIAIIFTFAEKPCTEGGLGGSPKIYGTTNPEYITAELKKVLEDSSISPYIYKDIEPETTIADLLRKPDGATFPRNILVKINHSNKEFYSNYALPDGIMASFGSMAMSEWGSNYISSISTLDSEYYSSMQQYPIYNGGGNIIADTKQNKMTYYYCQAQKTFKSGSVPTLEQRKSAINDVLSQAKKVYDQSNHNALFQVGIGGMANSDWDGNDKTKEQQDLAAELNSYLKDKIESMLSSGNSSELSPLGFVLMNYCLNENYGKPLIKDILEINTKFYLNRNKELDEWPENCGGNPYEDVNEGSEW